MNFGNECGNGRVTWPQTWPCCKVGYAATSVGLFQPAPCYLSLGSVASQCPTVSHSALFCLHWIVLCTTCQPSTTPHDRRSSASANSLLLCWHPHSSIQVVQPLLSLRQTFLSGATACRCNSGETSLLRQVSRQIPCNYAFTASHLYDE